MKRRGVALIELVISAGLTAIIVGAISTMFAVSVHHQLQFGRARADFESKQYFEDKVRGLLNQCYFSTDDTTNTYFVGDSVLGDSSVSDRITFTVAGAKVSGTAQASTSTDFGERNSMIGPIGGVSELALSTTAIGDSQGQTGLFQRKQTPADSDTTQGGYESVLESDVETIQFEFFGSTSWVATWDTAAENKLPDAVRVYYTLKSDPDTTRSFVVKVPQANDSTTQAGAAATP